MEFEARLVHEFLTGDGSGASGTNSAETIRSNTNSDKGGGAAAAAAGWNVTLASTQQESSSRRLANSLLASAVPTSVSSSAASAAAAVGLDWKKLQQRKASTRDGNQDGDDATSIGIGGTVDEHGNTRKEEEESEIHDQEEEEKFLSQTSLPLFSLSRHFGSPANTGGKGSGQTAVSGKIKRFFENQTNLIVNNHQDDSSRKGATGKYLCAGDFLVGANRQIIWKIHQANTWGLVRCKVFQRNPVTFLDVVPELSGQEFAVCILISGSVVIFDTIAPFANIFQIDDIAPLNHYPKLDSFAFSVARSGQPGVFVISSCGFIQQSSLHVTEVNMKKNSWKSLLLGDSEGQPRFMCVAAARDNFFGLVAASSKDKLMLFDHKGCLHSISQSGIERMEWNGPFLYTFSRQTGQLARWTLIPSKKGRGKRRLNLQCDLTWIHSLSQSVICSSIDLKTTNSGVIVASCVYAGTFVLFLSNHTQDKVHTIELPHCDLPSKCTLMLHEKTSYFINNSGCRENLYPAISAIIDDKFVFSFRQRKVGRVSQHDVCIQMGDIELPDNVLDILKTLSPDNVDFDENDSHINVIKIDGSSQLGLVLALDSIGRVHLWLLNAGQDVPSRVLGYLPRNVVDIALCCDDHGSGKLAIIVDDERELLYYDLSTGEERSDEKQMLPQGAVGILSTQEGSIKFINSTKEGQVIENYMSVFYKMEKNFVFRVENAVSELFCTLPSDATSTFSFIGIFKDFLVYKDQFGKATVREICSPKSQRNRQRVSFEFYSNQTKDEGAPTMPSTAAFQVFTVPALDMKLIQEQEEQEQEQERLRRRENAKPSFGGNNESLASNLDPLEPVVLKVSKATTFERILAFNSANDQKNDEIASDGDLDSIGSNGYSTNVFASSAGFGMIDESRVIGYWRFHKEEEEEESVVSGTDAAQREQFRNLSRSTRPVSLKQRNTSRPKFLDTVVSSCTSLDPGDEEFVYPPRSITGTVIIEVDQRILNRAFTLEFWFCVSRPVEVLVEEVAFVLKPEVFEVGRWYHLAVVFSGENGGDSVAYIDGERNEEDSVLKLESPLKLQGEICLFPGQTQSDCQLTELRLWDIARTQYDIDATRDTCLDLAETRKKRLMVRIN